MNLNPTRIPSPREREVGACVAQGYTRREIAETLGIKPGTVSAYLARLMTKVDARNRRDLIVWAKTEGLL